MQSYLTVFSENQTEYVEKRSRFIATLRHCETETEVTQFLEEMRSKYWDARHNCFAYSLKGGKLCRFSDDGEPHGTAGKPMLDVIVGSGVTDIAVVVTRYFGGVLLGTGGLVRAYSKSVQEVLQSAEVVKMVPSAVLGVCCDYTDHGKLVNLITACGGNITDTQFAHNVTVEFCIKAEDVESFQKNLTETFSARLKFEVISEKLMPFKEN